MISIVGGAIGSVLVLTITIGLSALSYRLGWDLDSVSTPMVTALGDMTTLPSLFLATFLVRNEAVAVGVGIVAIGVAVAATVRSYVVRDRRVRRIVLEMTATILLTPILDILSGGLQQARLAELTAVPVLLLLIPPFVSQAGALGGIFSSRITSKLQLGVITPRGRPETPAIVDGSIVARAVGRRVHVDRRDRVGARGDDRAARDARRVDADRRHVAGRRASVTPLTVVAGYYLAIVTYRFGLDPDNQGVPIITSVMDLAGVAVILLVMTSSGVLPMDDTTAEYRQRPPRRAEGRLGVDGRPGVRGRLLQRGEARRGGRAGSTSARPGTCGACARWRCSRREAPRMQRAWPACCGSPTRSSGSARPPPISRV